MKSAEEDNVEERWQWAGYPQIVQKTADHARERSLIVLARPLHTKQPQMCMRDQSLCSALLLYFFKAWPLRHLARYSGTWHTEDTCVNNVIFRRDSPAVKSLCQTPPGCDIKMKCNLNVSIPSGGMGKFWTCRLILTGGCCPEPSSGAWAHGRTHNYYNDCYNDENNNNNNNNNNIWFLWGLGPCPIKLRLQQLASKQNLKTVNLCLAHEA